MSNLMQTTKRGHIFDIFHCWYMISLVKYGKLFSTAEGISWWVIICKGLRALKATNDNFWAIWWSGNTCCYKTNDNGWLGLVTFHWYVFRPWTVAGELLVDVVGTNWSLGVSSTIGNSNPKLPKISNPLKNNIFRNHLWFLIFKYWVVKWCKMCPPYSPCWSSSSSTWLYFLVDKSFFVGSTKPSTIESPGASKNPPKRL